MYVHVYCDLTIRIRNIKGEYYIMIQSLSQFQSLSLRPVPYKHSISWWQKENNKSKNKNIENNEIYNKRNQKNYWMHYLKYSWQKENWKEICICNACTPWVFIECARRVASGYRAKNQNYPDFMDFVLTSIFSRKSQMNFPNLSAFLSLTIPVHHIHPQPEVNSLSFRSS